jgi:2-polyprenyl-3-methyl-5-hydroxy-6-metoxy-1,4-benzoquinol methylase
MNPNLARIDQVRQQFDAVANKWNAEAAEPTQYFTHRIPIICEFIRRHAAGVKYMDVGCAAGVLSYELATKGMDVYGTDVSQEMVLHARRRLSSVVANVDQRFRVSVNGTIPFSGDTFDVITALWMLPYVPHRKEFIQELKNFLSPGGYLVASSINRFSFHTITSMIKYMQYFRPNSHWVGVMQNLWKTGFWSGGALLDQGTDDITSASRFDALVCNLGFELVGELNFYNLRPTRYRPLDRHPLDRKQLNAWCSRRFAWEHIGCYRAVR